MVNKYNETYFNKLRLLIHHQTQNDITKYVNQALNVLIRFELVDFFDNYTPPEDAGYMFDATLKKIYIEVDKEAEGCHSGNSIGMTMRILKNIMNQL